MAKTPGRKIELVSQKYQPNTVEAEEVIVLRKKDGAVPTATEVMRALTRPVEITYIEKPEGKGSC